MKVIMGLLQNMWLQKPEHRARMEYLCEKEPKRYLRMSQILLMQSHSGRRLQKGFSKRFLPKIQWVESTPVVAGDPRDIPDHDIAHIARFVDIIRPQWVLTFGGVARRAWEATAEETAGCLVLPKIHLYHPACRRMKDFYRQCENAERLVMGYADPAKIKYPKERRR